MTEFYGTFEGELDNEEEAIRIRLNTALPEGVELTGLEIRE